MSLSSKDVDNPLEKREAEDFDSSKTVATTEQLNVTGCERTKSLHQHTSSASDRQLKFERAQKCLENAAKVSKRIKEHRKATAELLGRPFEDDEIPDTASEMASTISERTGYSAATDISTTLSVQEALNIPGISESLANTLKQKEILIERIKQYKEISKRPIGKTNPALSKRESGVVTKLDSRRFTGDVTQLQQIVKEKENALSVMQVKMRALETTILDLQEKINEKDMILEAKTKATALMSDNLSKKEKDSLSLLEDTRQQMTKMQENFISMELEWKEEKHLLLNELEQKTERIKHLEEANAILENSRFALSVENSKITEELNKKNTEIEELQHKLNKLIESPELLKSSTSKISDESEVEKGTLEITKMVEMSSKIELLEQLNCQIRQANKELEFKLINLSQDSKSNVATPPKKNSPVSNRKSGRNMSSKMKSPWIQSSHETDKKQDKNEDTKIELVIQSLNKDILDKELFISQKDALIMELKKTVAEKTDLVNELEETLSRIEQDQKSYPINAGNKIDAATETLSETVDVLYGEEHKKELVNVVADEHQHNFIGAPKDLEYELRLAHDKINLLNSEIEMANKNMIKVKAAHKLKIKQMQKTIDNFGKVSDTNAEIVKLNEEIHQLTQKVAELEEEKGNLQLHLVDYDSGRLTESDTYKKMIEMESLAEARLKSISVLEAQKFELVQGLHILKQKNVELEDKLADLSHLQSEQVSSEMKSVQLEEEIDEITTQKKDLEIVIESFKHREEELENSLILLQQEKEELGHKLEQYIQENMELSDKLEKLSAEKVSSAESIEIVESLTTQEKLELEAYNKSISNKNTENQEEEIRNMGPDLNESVFKLTEESAELNKKIELFTLERQEVMDKMSKLNIKNEELLYKITELNNVIFTLQITIDTLNTEKDQIKLLNEELSNQIEELKRERIEILKETAHLNKPLFEEVTENINMDAQQEDKTMIEKGNKTKSVKQLTKEILKLKNVIKEREDEIADCQMKILSLEEQHQKYSDLIRNNQAYEAKLKTVTDEKDQLKEELLKLKENEENKESEIQSQKPEELQIMKQTNETLQLEIKRIENEYNLILNARDVRIQDLENLLREYENRIQNYNNTLQHKDKELSEYINQVTKLNDVSQKLKSTIELLEEEKAKDQNVELIKSLNMQISMYQKSFLEYDDKIKTLEEEKMQLLSTKTILENQSVNLETELKNLNESLSEKQSLLKDLQSQKQKYDDEISTIRLEVKERDEEIHEIKLQLRKESIENEKLHTNLIDFRQKIDHNLHEIDDLRNKLSQISFEKEEVTNELTAMETKNKELMEKLKKFAVNLKKKSNACSDLEKQLQNIQNQFTLKVQEFENMSKKVCDVTMLKNKVSSLEEEINRISVENSIIKNEKSNDVLQLQQIINSLEQQLQSSKAEITTLVDTYNTAKAKLEHSIIEKAELNDQIEMLNRKLVDFEIEKKNNINFLTKISGLENDIYQKQEYISELMDTVENLHLKQNGYEAKIQEGSMYIEHLESEISRYKNRISRLEESISAMEHRRCSLERKADQLDSQLQEKHKAYSEYASHEDELVNRLAILMDHDKVVEKQLREIENENNELQLKNQNLIDDNQNLRKITFEMQDELRALKEKANKTEMLQTELTTCQSKILDLESYLKKLTNEHQLSSMKKKEQIDELESEFNTQIENALKEKKSLNEKHEKLSDKVIQLEQKLYELSSNNHTLSINLDEMTKLNQELRDKVNSQEKQDFTDYTEQYISEINNLQSLINDKNNKISDLSTTIQTMEQQIIELNYKISNTLSDIEMTNSELIETKHENKHLKILITQKDENIKQLIEQKSVTFEMTIPKTEGMFISSTIEDVNEEPLEKSKLTNLESQIVSDISDSFNADSEHMSKPFQHSSFEASEFENEPVAESLIIPKNTYLCYEKSESQNTPSGDVDVKEPDAFHSEEGWGFQESGVDTEIIPGTSHLQKQIATLKKENDRLKTELNVTNNKLLKALKKLKEMKLNNEILSNELKLSKELSQSAFLDTAIEDELKSQVNELNHKIEELQADLIKEKREKQSLRKQNEVFNNANDRLTEMKEKLDSEVELWKFKFKEVNDKMSTLQWSVEQNEPSHKSLSVPRNSEDCKEEDYDKLEKENEELQLLLDQINSQNNELTVTQTELRNKIYDLQEKMQQVQKCDNCVLLRANITQLEQLNNNIINENNVITKKLLEIEEIDNNLKQKHEELLLKYEKLYQSIQTNSENNIHIEDRYKLLESQLNDSKGLILTLETALEDAHTKLAIYEKESTEMTTKLQNLNTENDQLLSTVTELRSSISSAVDQRGYEIAEMWKQHLAQREADFAKTEQELRAEINSFENKYEQLLDNMQSSNQEETNKLVIIEQHNTLQNKLRDKEEHLMNLQNKYSDLVNEMDMLRSEIEDEKVMHENKILSLQEEYENQISEMTIKLEQDRILHEQIVINLNTELNTATEKHKHVTNEIEDMKLKLVEFENKNLELSNEIRMKESEIYQKTHDYTLALTQRNEEFEIVRKQLLEYERKLEELTYEKESELAVLRLKMHDNSTYYESTKEQLEKEKSELSEMLNGKILECAKLNKEITDLNKTLEDNINKTSEMQVALENQEIEIVSMNDEVSKLQELLKMSISKIDKHVTFASGTKPGSDDSPAEIILNKSLLDPAPQAELDLALYMLHQRDVRCEELTMELTQLLEERDTLQLRLSDSLRSCEDLKNKCKSAGLDVSFSSSLEGLPESPNSSGERGQLFVDTHKPQTSRSSSISDVDGDKPKLQAKLSELRTVRHSRDVRLRQDSEQRQLSMRLLQRDVANLPAEAADQLRQAHHTLSRDTESTSTVLLNWLRGKSTPKVVHM